MKRRVFVFLISFFLIVIAFLFFDFFFFSKRKGDFITIGSKNIAESQILAEVMTILIEKKSSLKVKRKYNLEGTFISFKSLTAGDIDIYPEYSGTALLVILKEKIMQDPEKSYSFIKENLEKRFNITALKPFGFQNNFAVMMLEKKSRELNINSILDLKNHKNLIFGFNSEFIAREEFKCLKSVYDLKFKKSPKIMEHVFLYFSLSNGSIDAMVGFTTDASILYYDLKVLKDPKKCFPEYVAMPLIRKDTLKKYPYLEGIINQLYDTISDEEMQRMNYKVDYKGKSIKNIALEFLKEKKLL
jgi:glycine betaine/choline ABC-type transport system substrate-binding protein